MSLFSIVKDQYGKPLLAIEDAKLIFRNFEGRETQYNREGNRNFGVIIDDPEWAKKLEEDGWNVRTLKSGPDDQDEPRRFISVAVNYKPNRNGYTNPPKINIWTGKQMNPLTEETVHELDGAYITNADLIINPSHWEVNGKTGVKAYCKELIVTLEKGFFDNKYVEEEIEEVPF